MLERPRWTPRIGGIMAVASLIVAVLALLVAFASSFDGRRQAVEANGAAKRAADAAERQTALAEREAARYAPPWRLENGLSGHAWTLTNDSDEHAIGVRVRAVHESLSLIGAPDGVDVGPGSAVSFIVAANWGTSDFNVRVTWQRPGEATEREWIHPVR
jgi:hypothetical protein